MHRLALAPLAVLLLAPAVAGAQPYTPRPPVAFTGPTQAYQVSGCGSGPLSFRGGPSVTLFCLDGTATVGLATSAVGTQFFQVVLDLTGTRQNGFTGSFFDVDYSNLTFPLTYQQLSGRTDTESEGFAPARLDLTGRTTAGYALRYPVTVVNGVTVGGPGQAELGYVFQDAPRPDPSFYGRDLTFALAVTATPEPATLALTLGGLAVLGAGAWLRRRTT